MADKKISQLPASTTLDGTELVPIVQGGVTVQATTQEVADLNKPTLQSVTDEGRTTTHSITANSFIKTGGTASQFLKANGTVDNSIYITIDDVPDFVNLLKQRVKADENLIKGQAVYVSGASGANILVQKGDNRNESTSSKILGLIAENLALNGQGYVVTEGILEGLDTNTANEGDPVWLGINGELIYGLANKPYAPEHLVFIGIVTRASSTVGSIFVKVQNGFELNEIHDVDLITTTPSDNEVLTYEFSTGLWKNKSVVSALGFTPYNATNPSGYITSSALTSYVPYTGATANVDLGTRTLTTPIINGVSSLLRFGSTDRVSVGNYATPSAQRIFTVGQDTAFVSIGSLVGSTSFSALYMNNTATPSGANYTIRGGASDTILNCPAQMYLSRAGTVFMSYEFGMRTTWNMLSNPFGYVPFNITKNAVTGATASTPLLGWNYLGGSTQWPTGNITTQSENVWGATTYSFVGASTITNAYGNVFNAPIAGTNATITNNFSAQFNGQVQINGSISNNGGSPNLGTSGAPYGTFFITNIRGGSDLSFGSGFSSSGDKGLVMFSSTRNVLISNGGTFTDNGYRLDVNGTGRFQNTLRVTNNLIAGFNTTPRTGTISDGVTSVLGNLQNFTTNYHSGEVLYSEVSGEALNFGQLCYRNAAGKWQKATGSSSAIAAYNMLGICLHTVGATDTATSILIRGYVESTYLSAGAVGSPLFMDATTAGSITDTAPSTVGNIVRIIGNVFWSSATQTNFIISTL